MTRILTVLFLLCAGSAQVCSGAAGIFRWGVHNHGARYIDMTTNVSVFPMSWIFGNVSTGVVHSKTFTFTSTGLGVWERAILTVTGTGFSESSRTCGTNPFDLASGASCTGTVSFAPTAAGSFTGFLNYSAPNFTRQQIALSGAGIATGGWYTDSFSTDGALSAKWTVSINANSALIPVVSGGQFTVGGSTAGRGMALYTGDSYGSNQCVQATQVNIDGSNKLWVRTSSDGLSGYSYRESAQQIFREDSGSPTSIATDYSAENVGDVMRLCANGSTITISRNGTVVATATDTTYSTGSIGLMVWYTGIFDNFAGGNYASAP